MNEILQVITLTDMWLFLPFPLFCFILEDWEVHSPQRSKRYFRLRSSWKCGWARTWLQEPLEDWWCSDGSALRRWPGRIRYSTWRLPDANSQRSDFYSGCSHSWSLVNSLSAAALCRWEAYLHIYPTQRSLSSFLFWNPLFLASTCMLFAFKEPFLCHSIHMGQKPVCQTQILKSWPHLPSHNLLCWLRIYKEEYGKTVIFLFICISQLEWQFPLSLNPEITYMFSRQLQMHPTSKELTLLWSWTFLLIAHGSTVDNIFFYLVSQRC